MKMKHMLMTVAAPLTLAAAPADAAMFTFTLTGAYTASFEVDESAFLTPDDFDDYFEVEANGAIGGRTGNHIVAFNTTMFDGGLTLGDNFTNLWGPQLFTGTTAAPTLLTGDFSLLVDGEAGRTVSLSITAPVMSAIPEPLTWSMMVIGFGAVGAAMRRRRVTFVTA
jgi:hypothetical protein